MSNMDKFTTTAKSAGSEFDNLMDALRSMIEDGIKHGFFTATISVTTPRSDRREVLVSAGKSHKYTIRTDDLLPH